jgi:hypothetical protein
VAAAPTQRVSYGALAAAGGGALLIIGLFLDWQSEGPFSVDAWQIFSIDDIILFVLALFAIFLAVLELPAASGVNLPFTRARALTTVGLIATTIVWAVLLESDHLAFGIFLSGIASIAILVGGILAERSPHLGMVMGGRAAAIAQQGPGAFQQGGGYGQQPGGYAQQPGYQQQQQQQPVGAAAGTPATQQQPAAAPQAGGAMAPPDRPGQPADWYPDPQGLKRLRYWDGSQWTEHVAD